MEQVTALVSTTDQFVPHAIVNVEQVVGVIASIAQHLWWEGPTGEGFPHIQYRGKACVDSSDHFNQLGGEISRWTKTIESQYSVKYGIMYIFLFGKKGVGEKKKRKKKKIQYSYSTFF